MACTIMNIERIFRVRLFFGILVGELLAYLVVLGVNAVVFTHFFYARKASALEDEEAVARTLGHNVCLNFCIQLTLPQRNNIWIPLLGVSCERMLKYHRIMGRVLFGTITAHLISWWVYWISASQLGYNKHILHDTGALEPAALIGTAAWLCVVIMIILSLEYFRRSKFELFYYSHHLFLVVIALALVHSVLVQKFWAGDMLIYWLTPGIIMYIVDRGFRLWRSRTPTDVISIEQDEGGGVYHVRLRQRNFRFEAGQFVYVNFPQISALQWHPFSISTSPSDVRMTPGGSIFSIAVRDMGPNSWARQMIDTAEKSAFQRTMKVRVEGPYGKCSIDIFEYPVLVLIAGGIGVTPLFSILSELHNNPPDTLEKIYFIWTAKEQNYLSLFLEYLADMERNDFYGHIEILRYVTRNMVDDIPKKRRVINVDDDHIMTASNSSSAVAFMQGRPDFNEFFTRTTTTHGHQRIGVVACGPPQMMDDVKNTCNEFNTIHKPKIDIHCEGFCL